MAKGGEERLAVEGWCDRVCGEAVEEGKGGGMGRGRGRDALCANAGEHASHSESREELEGPGRGQGTSFGCFDVLNLLTNAPPTASPDGTGLILCGCAHPMPHAQLKWPLLRLSFLLIVCFLLSPLQRESRIEVP